MFGVQRDGNSRRQPGGLRGRGAVAVGLHAVAGAQQLVGQLPRRIPLGLRRSLSALRRIPSASASASAELCLAPAQLACPRRGNVASSALVETYCQQHVTLYTCSWILALMPLK
jgi:hypothetical protein